MTTPIFWPRTSLTPRHISVDIASRSLRTPSSLSGYTQVVSSDAGIWTVRYDEIPVYQGNGSEQALCFQAISGLAEGMLNPLLVHVYTRGRRPLPAGVTDDMIDFDAGVTFDTGATFDDATTFYGYFVDCVVGASAAVRATTITITKRLCGTIEPGHRFSIGYRLYQVRTVTSQDDDTAVVTIRPPLREAISVDQVVEFDNPVVQVRLASDAEMNLPLQFNKWSFPTVNFIEDY